MQFVFDESYTDIEDRDEHGNSLYYFYDISRFSKEQIVKGFSFSYEIPSKNNHSELVLILAAEFLDGRVIAVEHLV